jgi:signal transduction histidine kinase
LGLYIVKKYLENIDGTIDFVSEPEQGTTFTIRIPKEDFQ